jgi:hypothetical protein
MANIPAHMRIQDDVSLTHQALRARPLPVATLAAIGVMIGLAAALTTQLAGVIH